MIINNILRLLLFALLAIFILLNNVDISKHSPNFYVVPLDFRNNALEFVLLRVKILLGSLLKIQSWNDISPINIRLLLLSNGLK